MSSSPDKLKLLARLGSPLKSELHLQEPEPRPVLEQIIYAVLREGVSREQADRGFANLRDAHFDLNEVRVSTAREVADSLRTLPNRFEKASRIIEILQELFETTYDFDLESIAKKGLKLAEKQLERFRGTTPFVVSFVVQNALGGHALPLDAAMHACLERLALAQEGGPKATQAWLEHHVPKAKGPLFFEALSAITHRYCHEKPRCSACPLKQNCEYSTTQKDRRTPAKGAATSKAKTSKAEDTVAAPARKARAAK